MKYEDNFGGVEIQKDHIIASDKHILNNNLNISFLIDYFHVSIASINTK